MDGFVELQWSRGVLEKFGLPDVGYPVPTDALEQVLLADGQVDFDYMLYWFQEYCSAHTDEREDAELAMRRLVELIAPDNHAPQIPVEGDFWRLWSGQVELADDLIALQRRDRLIAALMPEDDGSLILSVYRPLDASSARKIMQLSRIPHPVHGVQMRENNWEYALDSAAHSMSALMACENGDCYLNHWEFGLGITPDGEDDALFSQRELNPMPANQAAVQLGVYYQHCPLDALQ